MSSDITDLDDLRGMLDTEVLAEIKRLNAEVERLTRERDRAYESGLGYARAVRQILDMAYRRAHKQIIDYARAVLGGVADDPAEAERAALAAQVAALWEAFEHADEVARLTTWGITVTDCREACEHPACLILRAISRYRKTRAALAAAGGEDE